MKKTPIGHIHIPQNRLIQPHEPLVATILSWTGDDVYFLTPTRLHTADIKFRELQWEIKSPKGSSSRTIENNMRNALKQSRNIIIDLQRIKQPEQNCIREIQRQAKLIHSIKHIIIITKQKQIIQL